MTPVPYLHLLQLALPEALLALTSILVLIVDLVFLRTRTLKLRFTVASGIASLGCLAAIVRLLAAPVQATVFNGMFLANPLTDLLQIALLTLTILTLLLSIHSTFTDHIGEFVFLILLATTGMLFLIATQDLLVIFLALELLSLSLYILTAFNKHSPRSAEAALKYFLFGGMSAAFLLFGFSLLYGLAGSTSLTAIAATLTAQPLNPILVIALVTTLIGFGFKVAAAPFHFWAPDVYLSAPNPAAAFIASASKVASFFLFFEVLAIAFAPTQGSAAWLHFTSGWAPALALVATASMLLGNLVAIVQTSARRLLAYSAVAHAGYMLLGILAHTPQSLAALLYYVLTYALATLGLFAAIGIVETQTGSDALANFNGLSRRSPVLSLCLFIFFLSLAGIPPLAGFFGKFYLFVAALATPGLLWLAALAIATSAVSLYYYLQVLKRIYVTAPAPQAEPIRSPLFLQTLIVLLAAATLLLGCAPNLLLHPLAEAIRLSSL